MASGRKQAGEADGADGTERLLLKDRCEWIPKALRDGTELGEAAAKVAEEFLLTSSFIGVGHSRNAFRHCADETLARWFKDRIEAGLAARASSDNPGLDAALLVASGVQPLGQEIARLADLGNHPQTHLLLGKDLFATASAFAAQSWKAHATSCPDLVALMRPAYEAWLADRDDMVHEEATWESGARSYGAVEMDATIGGFFRALETNRPTGILRALVWGGILSLRSPDTRTPPAGRGPAVWINGALAIAATMGGARGGCANSRSCHYLLDEGYRGTCGRDERGIGGIEEVVGLAGAVYALSCVAAPATEREANYLIPAHGFGNGRTDMVFTTAQLLNRVPLGGLNMKLVDGGAFFSGHHVLRHMPEFENLSIMERGKLSPWLAGHVHRIFAKAAWACSSQRSGSGGPGGPGGNGAFHA